MWYYTIELFIFNLPEIIIIFLLHTRTHGYTYSAVQSVV